MLRSLMTAVTGVKAHQVMLDVTGNNIANVNTTGFKKDFTIFQDLLYQTSQGATGPGDQRGGVNPAQVGLGVRVGAIETIHTQGYFQFTGNKNDMMIDGEGYFVFRDGTNQIYGRAGNFTMDAEKNLVHSGTGYYVQGYKMIRDPLNAMNYIPDSSLSDINIPIGDKLEARATSIVGYRCNLDSESEPYLPIGFADIKSTDTEISSETLSPIGETIYQMAFTTNPLYNGTSVGPNGAGTYFSINIGYPDSDPARAIRFYMAGITDEGYPDLRVVGNSVLSTTSGAAASRMPDGELLATSNSVVYEADTGALKIVGEGGNTLWSTNLFEKMNYKTFTVGGSGEGNSVQFIAEFNEKEMDDSPMPLTLWWEVLATGTTAAGNYVAAHMGKAVYDVYVNQDGTFESVILDTAPSATDLPKIGDHAYDFMRNAGDAGNFFIRPSEDGASLEIRATSTPDPSANATMQTVDTINQGGFHSTKVDIFDCQGKMYTLEVVFKKLTENRWRWEASLPGEEKMFMEPSSGELQFDDSCKLKEPPVPQPITIDFGMNGTSIQTIELDFSGESFGLDVMQGVTQFASDSTTKGYYQDGYTMGVLYDYSVGNDGVIMGAYTNSQNIPIYRVGLAQFANPMGLDKVGDSMFRETINSGKANINPAMVDGGGSIKGGNLEMSNVDLTEEFTRLIIAQRGFQANTRVVTTSDQILEEVVNLKR